MTEADLVKKMMTDAFITQFKPISSNVIYNLENFLIKKIPAKVSQPIAFEVYHILPEVKFRLRAYMTLGKTNYLDNYTLAVTYPAVSHGLGDEVFWTTGTFSEQELVIRGLEYKNLISLT